MVETEATIKIWVPTSAGGNERRYVYTSEGNGPVHALDCALRAAIGEVHPHLREIELVNYKVRILDETKGTGAVTRVLLDASDGQRVWGSIGVSENLIAASWDALVDSLEYGMQPEARPPAPRKSAKPPRRGKVGDASALPSSNGARSSGGAGSRGKAGAARSKRTADSPPGP
jgi:2-isopropylmalate synthase